MQNLKLDTQKDMENLERLLSLDLSDKKISLLYDLKFMTPFTGILISSFLNDNKFDVTYEVGDEGRN